LDRIFAVMPGLVPGIHVFLNRESDNEDVDGRDKPGHDESADMETALATDSAPVTAANRGPFSVTVLCNIFIGTRSGMRRCHSGLGTEHLSGGLSMKSKIIMVAAVLGTSLVLAAAPAQARYWHHGGAWGAGIAGFAAGAILGSALAPRPYYYYGPPAYAYEPGYPDDAEAYCEARFRSYDPESGTYLGYDGRRHPCP
jgi:hypothetical protein